MVLKKELVMSIRTGALVLVASLLTSILNGQEGHFSALINRLDAPTFSERTAASRKLASQGTKALDAVVQAQHSTVAEVKLRARSIEKSIVVPHLITPSRVTLSGRMSVREVLDEIEFQTGNKIPVLEPLPTNYPVVDYQIRHATFWEALLLVCEKTNYTITPENNEFGWTLREGKYLPDFFSASGVGLAKRTATYEVWSTQVIQLIINLNAMNVRKIHPQSAIGFHFNVFLEPRLSTAQILDHAMLLKARTQEGIRLQQVINREPRYLPLMNGAKKDVTIMCPVSIPPEESNSLENITFKVFYDGYGNTQEASFDNPGDEHIVHQISMVLDTIFVTEDHFVYELTSKSAHPIYVEVDPSMGLINFADVALHKKVERAVKIVIDRNGRNEPPSLKLRVHHAEYASNLYFTFKNLPLPFPL
jgi:hypothetical protein